MADRQKSKKPVRDTGSRGTRSGGTAPRSETKSRRAPDRAHNVQGTKQRHRDQAKNGRERNPIPDKQFTVHEPAELLPFLLQNLSNMGRNSVKALLARGQVSVNEQAAVTAYNHPLQPGHTVTIRMDKTEAAPPMIGLTIMHEDEDLIVIQKDAGLLSIASSQEPELTAYRQLTDHVRRHHPSNRIFVVHRLDRDTSGVMMFAKSEEVQQKLQNGWKDLVNERKYVALVEGMVNKPEGTISSWLKESKTLKMYSSPYPNDGQHAVTHYKVIQASRSFSLLEVQLETGRKNQIRVHMQDMGHPIAGDKKYGSTSKPIGRLGLHARVLSFQHPVTGEPMRFETDIPKSFLAPFRTDTPDNSADRRNRNPAVK
ncbi:RluA family pseudouridine synthase [Paenibacillus spongiae]|uniref:Pseudouridine synthase n=1 Tax=Paenibacillus spongiae TaxID=2909671 RepID=A0ABY5SFD7_9BACL|nr:RluA family pseudouridine synthase [Paenibacillus spongiae]UVI31467.1 RluA family pseudouridine synthase [Paenibacillus spongiae]